jgi:hypothetical protein
MREQQERRKLLRNSKAGAGTFYLLSPTSAGISGSAGAYVQVTGGKKESDAVTGVNAEVSVTEASAKQGGRFDWTPDVCSVQFVPLRVWMIRIFLVLLSTPPRPFNLNQIGSTARFLACSTWVLAQLPCHCRSKPSELGFDNPIHLPTLCGEIYLLVTYRLLPCQSKARYPRRIHSCSIET